MKKLFMLGLSVILFAGMLNIQAVYAEDEQGSKVIKAAIEKYKAKNFVGCISDLRLYTDKDPSNAIAWYYLGNAYMNIAMKPEAHSAFEKVVELNTVPKLTSYSIQAQICMENPAKCQYQNFSYEEIKKLKADPTAFLEQYFASLNSTETKDPDTIEIEKLINGDYPNNIHKNAKEFIDNERAKMRTTEINENKAYIPSDKKLAQAVQLLKDQNNQITSFAMMMDRPNTIDSSRYADIIEQYKNSGNKTITPEMVQLMMMQNMMPNF